MWMRSCMLTICVAVAGYAQLTVEQKIAEFEQMAGLFAKGYGPYEWKKQAFGIDLYDNAKWYERIRATKSDVEFFDVMTRWVAQLDDAHDSYSCPSNFSAQLNFGVDIYDGRLLVDSIDRVRLPVGQYPIAFGYELVSIDGVAAEKILEDLMPYNVAANPGSTRRAAAELLTWRPQSLIPNAHTTPEISTVVFRRYDGGLETYRIPWTRSGRPLTGVGVYPEYGVNVGGEESGEPAIESGVEWQSLIGRFTNFKLPRDRMIAGFGATAPVFARSLPGNFIQRLGRSAADPFYTGVFEASGYRIGYIRIPTFSPPDLNGALTVFVREISFFQENTDGLVVDIMRNGGGSSSYANALLGYLMYYHWQTLGVEVRATSAWIRDISSTLQSLRSQNAPAPLIRTFEEALAALIEANRSNRGMTPPLPWDYNAGMEREPLTTPDGRPLAYTKAMLLLVDEFSASAADGFAAIIQDNGRALLFGQRTMGAGGNVVSRQAGAFSGSSVSLTQSLLSRSKERLEPGGYPATRYVENVGVHPDYLVDYMTAANLFQNGKPFVDGFVAAIVEHIGRSR